MVTVKCEACGKFLEIPDRYRGESGKCNGCGATLVVPGMPKQKPVPKWKINALYALCGIMVATYLGAITTPDKPAAVRAPESKSKPATTPKPVEPPKPLTLEERLQKAIGPRNRDSALPMKVEDYEQHILVRFALNDGLLISLTKFGAQEETLKMLQVISKERPGCSATISGTITKIDPYGNESEDSVLVAKYSAETIAKINYDNLLAIIDNAWKLADSASIDKELR